jgi:hypothetical protein
MERAQTRNTQFVQFSDTDELLINEIGRAASVALDEGSAVVCIATRAHRQLLARHLTDHGLDVVALRHSGQFVALDAAETLAKIIVDGQPDVVRFAEVVGARIDRAATRYPRVWIFGDMVALMCAHGDHVGALRLEKLWRSFNKARSVFRYCAYPPNVVVGNIGLGPGLSGRF